MGEKIEILLATYNTEQEYLKKQIDSILNQTYQNFKLLISDDHSIKKEIKTILETYQKQDKRIEIYTQESNLGYNKNFEFLLKQAKANYIMFSDHDDIWYPQKIEKCLTKMKEEKLRLFPLPFLFHLQFPLLRLLILLSYSFLPYFLY